MKKSFTLAELLISMAIIGVISVLMLPVINNMQKKTLETQLLNFYSRMSNVIQQYMVENDTDTLYSTKMYANMNSIYNNYDGENEENFEEQYKNEYERASAEVDSFINTYLKVKRICNNIKPGVENECFPLKIKNLNDDVADIGHIVLNNAAGTIASKAYVLDNGVVFSMIPPSDAPAEIQVDVNGKRGPNVAGRDIWRIHLYKDGVLSENLHGAELGNKNNPDVDIEELKKKITEQNFDRCRGENAADPNAWRYGSGCFSKMESNDFKFDY